MSIRAAVDAMSAYVPGEQPEESDVLKLNTNENPYPPSPAVFEALGQIDSDALRRYPDPVGRRLVQAVADLHGLSPDQVLITNGSDEALALCTRAFCENGGRVGFLSPSYSLYPVLARIAELQQIPFPLAADFSWCPPERLDVELFLLTRPNAPTGLSLPLAQVQSAASACAGMFLVDEAYVDFADDSALPLLSTHPNLLITRSLSKSYSLAGLRLGYLLGGARWISALLKVKDSYNTDVLAQRLALAAVREQSWMIQNTTAVRGTRARLRRELVSRGFQVPPSQANFLFAKVPPPLHAEALFQALRDRKVYVRHFPGPVTGGYLRITVGTDAQMERFLDVLDGLLRSAG